MKKHIVCIVTLLSFSTAGFAVSMNQARANYHKGMYASAGLGTFVGFADGGDSLNYQAENGGFGGIAVVGMQTGPHFGFELDSIYGDLSYTQKYDNKTENFSVDGLLVGPAIKGIATIGDHFYLSGKIGLAYLSLTGTYTTTYSNGSPQSTEKENRSLFLPYDGITLGYAVNKKCDLQVDYTGLLYGVANAGLLSAGLTYHFA